MNTTAIETGSHLKALGLGRSPFPTTPDAACYFHTRELQEEMGEAVHCILSRKGFVLVTGEIGLGKSTFVRRIADQIIERDCVVSFVLNTFGRGEDLLRAINLDFGLAPGANFAEDVNRLNSFLVSQHGAGRTALIIIDDAQNLCLESLELLRMLSNFETSQEKLVQILLCGQPELVDKLSDPCIRQLASRIVKHVEMRALALEETRNYVSFRLHSAGSEGRITIAPESLRLLHRLSAGNPRRMHLILDRSLYGLVAMRTSNIKPQLIRRAAAESGIREPRSRLRRKSTRLMLAAVVACLATVVAASVLTRHQQDKASVMPVDAAHSGPSPMASATAAPPATAAAEPGPVATRDAGVTADGVEACLRKFGVDDAGGRIQQALQREDVGAVRALVHRQQPQLVVLAAPDWLQSPGNTAQTCQMDGAGAHLVLWRPADSLDDFALGVSGDGILRLQQALARSGDYHYTLDGLVGSRTTVAIASFQRRHGLAATGYPDDLTRFVIEHADSAAGSRPR